MVAISGFKIIRYNDEPEATVDVVPCVAYARYSTDNQSTYSTDDQLEFIRRHVSMEHFKSRLFPSCKFDVIAEFKDEAISGFSTVGRDGLSKALAMIRAGTARVILVAEFKRFIRGMQASLDLYELLQEYRAELISVSDNFSSSEPRARLNFMAKAIASEEFLEAVSADTKRGLDARRYNGFSDGHLWYGVGSRATREHYIKGKTKESHFEYYVIEKLALVVRRIFSLSRDGHSMAQIARALNSDGIPPPGHVDKEGNLKTRLTAKPMWRDKTVYGVLVNKAYLGVIERNRTKIVKTSEGKRRTIRLPRNEWIVSENENLRIVDQELWDGVRERLREVNARREAAQIQHGKPFNNKGNLVHPLSGMFRCSECDGPIVAVSGRRGGYYGCQRAHREHACENRGTLRGRDFEESFFSWVVDQLQDQAICVAIAERYNAFRRDRTRGEANDLAAKESRLAAVSGSVSNIVAAIEKGVASDSLIARLKDLEIEKAMLEDSVKFLRGVDKSAVFVTPVAVRQRLGDVVGLLTKAEPFEVSRAIKPLFVSKSAKLTRIPRADGKCDFVATGTLDLSRSMTKHIVGAVSSPVLVKFELRFNR